VILTTTFFGSNRHGPLLPPPDGYEASDSRPPSFLISSKASSAKPPLQPVFEQSSTSSPESAISLSCFIQYSVSIVLTAVKAQSEAH